MKTPLPPLDLMAQVRCEVGEMVEVDIRGLLRQGPAAVTLRRARDGSPLAALSCR